MLAVAHRSPISEVRFRLVGIWVAILVALLFITSAGAIEPLDYAVPVTARVSRTGTYILLSWSLDPNALEYVVSKRVARQQAWTAMPALGGTTTSYLDRNVVRGIAYEYRIQKSAREVATSYTGYGFIQAGMAVRPVADRGKLVLLVDETIASGLEDELARLVQDLVGDGWEVLRHDVSRTAPVPEIKAIIKTDYDADPSRVEAVFLVGHVPVPYSGDLNPDGHRDHLGAWPADAFYGDMDGTFTDETVNRTIATRPENHNVPGDGKYDATLIPSVNGLANVELQVGRVDLSNLPAFPESETELLRRYLDKNHAYRHRLVSIPPRGLIDDRFGAFVNEAFAVDGWRNFTPLIALQNTFTGTWLTALQSQSWLWAYGCGTADYSSIHGLVSTGDFATQDLNAVFVLLFGSYFGDWDTTDNLLRAPLAGRGTSLASVWAGRPHWHLYPMGLGETIGYSTRLTQNSNMLGTFNIGVNEMHVSLMGDPTLRLHPIAPPRNLHTLKSSPTTNLLRWQPSPDTIAGYHIYVSLSPGGPFRRLTTVPVVARRFSVLNSTRTRTFMVRAVKLEWTASGSYLNQSQGAIVTVPN